MQGNCSPSKPHSHLAEVCPSLPTLNYLSPPHLQEGAPRCGLNPMGEEGSLLQSSAEAAQMRSQIKAMPVSAIVAPPCRFEIQAWMTDLDQGAAALADPQTPFPGVTRHRSARTRCVGGRRQEGEWAFRGKGAKSLPQQAAAGGRQAPQV